jgi:DNA-binding GntR family transcriptional regulator
MSVTSPPARLSEKVFDWLVDQIVVGGLKPGQWISEGELTRRLGVSRAPVREALRDLARERIVEVRPRRGTVLTDLSPKDVDDLYRARELVDPELTALIVETMSEAELATMAGLIRDLQQAQPVADHYEATRRYTEWTWAVCPNRVVSDLSASLWRRSIPFRGVILSLPELRAAVVEHVTELLVLAERRDADAVREASRQLLAHIRETVLERGFIHMSEGHIQRPLAAPLPRGKGATPRER